ncbi:hypothetical protein ACPC54_33000 [Kitasatospora sp. NPDC094028]
MEPEFVGVVDPGVSAAPPGAGHTGLLGDHGLELRSAPTPRAAGPGEQARTAEPASEPSVVPVVWAPQVDVAPTGEVRRQAGSASVQRSTAGGRAAPASSGGRLAPRPLTGRHQPVLPLQGLSAPYQASRAVPVRDSAVQRSAPVARPGGAPADAGTVAVAAGIAQRIPDGSVLFAPPTPLPVGAGTELPVQRTASPPTSEPYAGPHSPPQADPPAGPSAGPPVQRAESPPSPAPPLPPAAPSESTDELVRRLIDPLGRLLRAELRLDRERAGRRFDTHY